MLCARLLKRLRKLAVCTELSAMAILIAWRTGEAVKKREYYKQCLVFYACYV